MTTFPPCYTALARTWGNRYPFQYGKNPDSTYIMAKAKKTSEAKETTIKRVSKTKQKNLSFSPQAAWCLSQIALHSGSSQTGIVEDLVRQEARRRGILRSDMPVDPQIDDPKYLRPGGEEPPVEEED